LVTFYEQSGESMEYIQAFLFTSRYIIGRSGNTDIFYLFAGFALLFYSFKRHDKLALVLKVSIPVAIVSIAMAFLYPDVEQLRCFVFLAKTILNITLMVFVAYNSKKWRMTRFTDAIVCIHAVETIIALMFRQSSLWVGLDIGTGDKIVSRLRLFYMDAASMAFTSGLIIVILVYQIMTEEVIWRQIIGIAVMAFDLYLSYGLTGIACVVLAIIALVTMSFTVEKQGKNTRINIRKYIVGIIFGAGFIGAVCALSINYKDRIRAIFTGTDAVVNEKIVEPIMNIPHILAETHFLGVGFGNGNTSAALSVLGANKAYQNSFLRIIAEGGVFGIILVGVCLIGIGIVCFKYGRTIDKALFIYIMVYQFLGGYFTDPANFFVYGWIIGDSIYNKIEATGSCRIKIFMPKKKDKLKIAEIGHKRIPSREGGVEVVVEEISKRMVKLGHSVDAYNRKGHHVAGAEYDLVDYNNLHEYEGIKIIKVPTIQRKGYAAMIYSMLASIAVIFRNYDVVHFHAEGPCAFIWLPSLFGIRTVATIHGIDWKRSEKWGSMASTFIHFGEKMAVDYADEIIVLSKQNAKYFKDTYNRDTVYIPNGIDSPNKREVDVIGSRWGLKKDGYMLLLARLTAEKGIHYAVEAYRNIDTDKKLVIAGGASDTENYVARLKELAGDDERIIFTGFVQGQELEELYSNAYLYCLPSDLEGMPISLLEAMSYGNCCLVSDIPECTSVIGENGARFEQGNVDRLRERMTYLINNPNVVAEYKKNAEDYILEKYKWDDVVDSTIKLYLGEKI